MQEVFHATGPAASFTHRVSRQGYLGWVLIFVFVCLSGERLFADNPGKQKPSGGSNHSESLSVHPSRVLVKPKAGTSLAELRSLHGAIGARVRQTFGRMGNLQIVELPHGLSVAKALAHYKASGRVAYAEPDYVVHGDLTPNDPKFLDGTLWAMSNTGQNGGTAGADIHAPGGWDTRTSASNIVVAVIDTGVRYTHEDLAANMWTNPGDGSHGTNVIAGTNDPMDDNGHGTHVAGTIGAVGNNGIGVVGVAWQVQIMACKFLNSSGTGYTSDAVTCIDYAIANRAQVMNNSWGGGAFSQALMDAITAAANAGIIFVASAGNSSIDNDFSPQYPASYDVPNVVAVAATDNNDQLAFFSNYGIGSVELGAPGVNIYSTFGTNDSAYATLSGTSMSAPHVSGVMALVLAEFPGLSYLDAIHRVLAATDPVASLSLNTISGGRLNLQNALSTNLFCYFTAMPQHGAVPLTVSFSDASLGTVTSRTWSFGDGSPTTSLAAPSNTYLSAGTFTARLTVSGPSGTSTRTRLIQTFYPISYQMVTASYGWIDPTSMTPLTMGDDTVSPSQPMPFAFTFYGLTYTNLYVGSNGLLGFNPSGLTKWANEALPTPNTPNAALYPYWDDFNPSWHGSVYVGSVGTAPNRIEVVSWVGVPLYADGSTTTNYYTFQVLLYEGSNDIVFQYQEVNPSTGLGAGRSATIGIENETGDLAAEYDYNGSAAVSDGQAIRFTTGSTAPTPGSLSVSPNTGLSSSGNVGGPFTPNSQSYTLSNPGGSSISWTASNTQPFVSLSATSGTLAAGASTTVTVSINASANTLAAGSYSDTVSFSNTSNGNGNTTRTVTLGVSLPAVISVTPVSQNYGSVLVGSTADNTFTVSNTGGGTLSGAASVTSPFSVISGGSYSIPAGSNAIVTVRFAPATAGSFTNTVTFTGGLGATAIVTGTGTAAPAAPSNLIATASGSTVTLQWVDNSVNEDGFKIERQDKPTGSGSFTSWAQIGTVGAGVTSYTDVGLQKGFHNYRVRAYQGTLNSGYSNTAQVKTQ